MSTAFLGWTLRAAILLTFTTTPLSAATIAGDPKAGTGPVTNGAYKVSLIVRPLVHLDGPTNADLTPMRNQYKNWTFNKGAASSGTFNILEYQNFALSETGGASLSVLYNDGIAEA